MPASPDGGVHAAKLSPVTRKLVNNPKQHKELNFDAIFLFIIYTL